MTNGGAPATALEVRRSTMRAMADETANLPLIALAPCCVLPQFILYSPASQLADGIM